jgi:hypothetical protein
MLSPLDNLLRHLFLKAQLGLTTDEQVGFQPPDQDWRNHVSSLQDRLALNIYLVDLRENLKLRSNAVTRTESNGQSFEQRSPLRVDCHYLITAWSPARYTPAIEPTIDEHDLLSGVVQTLFNLPSLIPREVYAPTPLPGGFPVELADCELPVAVLPSDGFPKYAEFWGTMGQTHPWKPAVYLVVTTPFFQAKRQFGTLVTTRITEYRQAGRPETAETWIDIGGTVRDPLGQPVAKARVSLTPPTPDLGSQTTTTDVQGRFVFGGLREGQHTITVQATDLGPLTTPISIPSPTGNYDIQFP